MKTFIESINNRNQVRLTHGIQTFNISHKWNTLDEATRMNIPQQKWKVNVYPFCGYKVYSETRLLLLTFEAKSSCLEYCLKLRTDYLAIAF